jgi:hypothetical protein
VPTIFPFAARFDQLSLSSCYLDLFANGTRIGNATGFLWRHGDEVYLVTNWHVVTNKDIFTNDLLDGPICPDLIRAYVSFRNEPMPADKDVLGDSARSNLQHPIDILVYQQFESPLWLQHKDWAEKRIDVVLLKLPPAKPDQPYDKAICLNDYRFGELMHFSGSELFIIGYPMKEELDSYLFPIWKNGTIAREPFAGWKNRPAFLVDSRTSKGMSGSLVVRRVFGPATNKNLEVQLDAVVTSEFLGIYSGRLYDGDKLPSIGIVWWRSVIDEILAQPTPGQRD